MTKPTIHLNGTSGDDLLEQYRNAMEAVAEAHRKVSAACPNGRDYYPQGPEAITAAMAEHVKRLAKLSSVYDELLELAVHCSDIIAEREARRAERNRP